MWKRDWAQNILCSARGVLLRLKDELTNFEKNGSCNLDEEKLICNGNYQNHAQWVAWTVVLAIYHIRPVLAT